MNVLLPLIMNPLPSKFMYGFAAAEGGNMLSSARLIGIVSNHALAAIIAIKKQERSFKSHTSYWRQLLDTPPDDSCREMGKEALYPLGETWEGE
jgi:hypothetical protein